MDSCPRSDSNRHWKDFKSSVSAIGLRGRQANLRLFTHKSHIYADISKDEEAHQLPGATCFDCQIERAFLRLKVTATILVYVVISSGKVSTDRSNLQYAPIAPTKS